MAPAPQVLFYLVLFRTGTFFFSRLQVLNHASIYEEPLFALACSFDRQLVHVPKTHVRAAGLPYTETQGQQGILMGASCVCWWQVRQHNWNPGAAN